MWNDCTSTEDELLTWWKDKTEDLRTSWCNFLRFEERTSFEEEPNLDGVIPLQASKATTVQYYAVSLTGKGDGTRIKPRAASGTVLWRTQSDVVPNDVEAVSS